ncbi:MAG: hypothetical protein E6G41_06865 [Actinobacteria bacterium]|nr:MAG: hypothetical protein E6G41_06865 [Actinomycetota bacterium]
MPSRLRRCLLLLVLPALVAGCGGSGGGDASTSTLLKDTFAGDKTVKSGKLDVSLGVQAQGLPSLTGPLAFKLAGPFTSIGSGKLPKFDFDLDIAAGGQTVKAGAVSLGDTGYLKFGGQTYSVDKALFDQFKNGYEKSQKQSKGSSGGASFKALGVNPGTWLTNARKVGKADVGGTETFHITSGVNVQRFLADVNTLLSKAKNLGGSSAQGVPQGLSPAVQSTIERSVKSAQVDVYTGVDDHALRRLALSVSLAVPKDAQKTAGGLKSGELRFDLTIADLNKAQAINAPAGARPFSELQSQIAALQGGSGSSSSASSSASASGTATTPSGSAPSAYLDCVQKAGSDLAQVQKCASLVNGG